MADTFYRPDGLPSRVIVVGGGVAALETVLALRALAGMRVDLELIAPDAELRYPPLEVIEPFGLTAPRIDLTEALAAVGARHRRESVTAVDANERLLRTDTGATLSYEAVVLAVGARANPPLGGALAFGGPGTAAELKALLDQAAAGHVEHILFTMPEGAAWSLPVYELAMLAAQRLRASAPPSGSHATRVAIATPEHAPLEIFGGRASGRVREQLDALGIAFHACSHVTQILRSEARLAPSGVRVPADRVVTIPTLRGPALAGLPHDAEGFLPVDRHGAVRGVDSVYAAGDATDCPIKQGGLATQQADAVARSIAARAGAAVAPDPFEGVLRGMLLTATRPQYLEADTQGRSEPVGGPVPLWWPPLKVAGRYLAPFLAERFDLGPAQASPPAELWPEGSVPCEVTLPAS